MINVGINGFGRIGRNFFGRQLTLPMLMLLQLTIWVMLGHWRTY